MSAHGLMTPRLDRLQRTKVTEMRREQLYECQLQVLHLVKAMDTRSSSDGNACLHYVASAASHHHVIKSFAEDMLQRVIKGETDCSPLEDIDFSRQLMVFLLGSQTQQSIGPLQGSDAVLLGNRTRVADASVMAAVSLLCSSKAAANVLPQMLQVVCQLMFGQEPGRPPNVAQRIKIAGVKLAQWVLHHCDAQVLNALFAPVLLPTFLRVLMDTNAEETSDPTFLAEFRHGIYECISLLSMRAAAVVVASPQPFQVVLVRCLVESASGLPTAANAVKALSAMQTAYTSHGSSSVLDQIESELIGLLSGSKLFEPHNRYERVRCAVATWAGHLLCFRQSTKLRFALFRLSGDSNDAVREAARTAIYTKPLPSVQELSSSLESMYKARDLKTELDPHVAKMYLEFSHLLVKGSFRNSEDVTPGTPVLLEYFIETLSHTTRLPAEPAVQALFKTIASCLVDLLENHSKDIAMAIGDRFEKLIGAAYASYDRGFLLDTSRLLQFSLENVDTGSQASIARRLINRSLASLSDGSKGVGQDTANFCSSAYLLGTSIALLDKLCSHQVIDSSEACKMASEALAKVIEVLVSRVAMVSSTTSIPRGEDAQKKLLDELRGCVDAVALSGTANELLRRAHEIGSGELEAHRIAGLEALCVMVQWKLANVSSDGSLKQKLLSIKQYSLEAISSMVIGSNIITVNAKRAQERVVDAVLSLGNQSSVAEMQFTIAQTLVSLGDVNDRVEKEAADSATSFWTAKRLLCRLADDFMHSSHPVTRRSVCVWLLTICTAGLASDSTGSHAVAWQQLFAAETASSLLIQVHEFFVSMLNDSDVIAKESAVKGLAYLRLRTPSKELGDQFSEGLFRRLRCYRAFTSIADSTTRQTPEPNANDEEDNQAESQEQGPITSSSRDTIDNIAYREVSNVAADIGDPELVYSLLYLSTTDPIWATLEEPPSHISHSFSFPRIDNEFRAQLIVKANDDWAKDNFKHGDKLLSWLFLLKHHGNSKVAQIMTNLWSFASGQFSSGSSEKQRSIVEERRNVMMDFVLAKIESSRNFKYREAGCSALTALLSGAEASDVKHQFTRLWKVTSRSVDDVTEAVAAVAVKLFRALGELSMRVAADDEQCRRELLDFLILDGMVSKNMVCRALSIDLILRVVKDIDAKSLRTRLAGLILKCLEYLSSLEIPELQYAQFHVEKKDQLERMRVSLSQSGPVGLLLEQCTTQLKALAVEENNSTSSSEDMDVVSIVDDLSRGIVSTLKYGVGLNTRVGTANFVATLATELAFELKKCKGADLILSRALLPFIRDRSASENLIYGDDEDRYGSDGAGVQDGLVLQSYCRAAAYLSPLVEPSLVKTFVQEGIFASAQRPSSDVYADSIELVDSSRFLLVSAIATKELVTKCPPIIDASALVSVDNRSEWYCGNIFPAAFIGQFAQSTALKTAWTEVMQALPPTVTHADASLDASLEAIGHLIRHPAWGTRTQAVRALQALFVPASVFRQRISMGRTDQIWGELLAAIPGRLWRGKGAVLEALVTIAAVRDTEAFTSLSRLLVAECDRAWKNRDTEYLESSLLALGSLCSTSQAPRDVDTSERLRVFHEIQARVDSWVSSVQPVQRNVEIQEQREMPPMMIKVMFETLRAVWPQTLRDGATDDDAVLVTRDALLWLCRAVAEPSFHVWSVRRAVFDTTAAVVAGAPSATLSNTSIANVLLERCSGELGVMDGRYSMIRVAAAGALDALLRRGLRHRELELVLVVNRERLESTVTTLRRSEEPTEQQAAARIASSLQSLDKNE
ncbi:hypothetical protein PINS_up014337 [Pythium insidiosum]|nr:hypothetical protein PINS_up014337 [Pythium insidiosum]